MEPAWNPPPSSAGPSAMRNKKVTKVSVGTNHACAIVTEMNGSSPKAYCWGDNSSGQLGNRSTTDSLVPVAVDTQANDYTPPPVIPNPCGGWFQPACTPVAQPTVPKSALANKTIVDISAGNGFTCALASDGNVACWGGNSHGQLGTNNTTSANYPRQLYKAAAYTIPGYCAVSVFGSCLSWVPAQNVPATTLWNKSVKSLAKVENSYTMCVTDRADKAYCWGNNDRGQVGTKTTATVTKSVTGACKGGVVIYPAYPGPGSFARFP